MVKSETAQKEGAAKEKPQKSAAKKTVVVRVAQRLLKSKGENAPARRPGQGCALKSGFGDYRVSRMRLKVCTKSSAP